MKEFPNYLMSANDNNEVAQYKNQSSVAFHYKINQSKPLERKEPEVIKTSIMRDAITRRPFKPTNVPSLLQESTTERINYEEIIHNLTLPDENIILCDNNRMQLEHQLEEMSHDTLFNQSSQKKRGLNQSMANILLNETQQVNYLNVGRE